MNTRRHSPSSWLALFPIVSCTLLSAQAGAQSVLEEVVVTAQKRAESLQDVPIAINAMTGDDLDRMGVLTAEQVLKLVPNAGTIPQGGAKQNFFIRGVGTADFHLNVVGAVGVFLDDVSLNSPFSVSFNTFDMERVEVLRGPQNTLFGRNTTGGAVNYISRKPSVEEGVNGYVRGGLGSHTQLDLEGAVGFPLGDKAALRFAAVSNTRDGPFNNLTRGEEAGERDRQAARAQLLMLPSDTVELLLNVKGGTAGGDPNPFKDVGTLDPNVQFLPPPGPDDDPVPVPCPVPADDIIPQNNPNCADASGFVHQFEGWEDTFGGTQHQEDLDVFGASFRAIWDAGPFTLTSITAFDSLEIEYHEDSDGAPNVIFQFYQDGEYDQFSQELRLTSPDGERLRWIAGLYYFSEDADYTTVVRRTPAPPAPSGPDMFNIVPNTIVSQDNEAISAFGQLDFDIRDDLTITAGYRWTNETKQGTNAVSVRCVGPNGGPPFCPSLPDNAHLGADLIPTLPALFEPPVEILDGDWNEWGARLAIDYQISEEAILYGSISRGFKGGGFSIAALQALLGLASQDVEPEVLWAYEVGVKSDWLGGAVRLNASAFFYDWEDYQSFQPLIVPGTGTAVPQLLNVPKSELIGTEVELTFVPGEGWYVQTGLGLLASEITDAGLIAGVEAGNELPNTPQVTFNGLVRKEIDADAGVWALQTDFRYRDDVTYDLANAPNLSQEGFWNLNARVSYTFGSNEQYDVSLWGENLTEEEYCVGMTSLAGLSEANICLPSLSEATFGLTGTVQFD